MQTTTTGWGDISLMTEAITIQLPMMEETTTWNNDTFYAFLVHLCKKFFVLLIYVALYSAIPVSLLVLSNYQWSPEEARESLLIITLSNVIFSFHRRGQRFFAQAAQLMQGCVQFH